MKRMLLIIGVVMLLIMVQVGYNKYTNKDIKLDYVNLKENKNQKSLAVMLETKANSNSYEESNSATYPTSEDGYLFNSTLSGCVDKSGKEIPNAVSYNNGTISFRTNSSSYCYVYFDLASPKLINYLLDEDTRPSSLWTSTLDGDGYRFVGTDPSNYICFGTTDKDSCVENADLYMYRIIGIFQDSEGNNHLKLIKKEALNSTYYWHYDYNNDVSWENSELYNGINGSYFLNNTTYSYMQNTDWTDMITDWTWIAVNTSNYGTSIWPNYETYSASEVYYHEMNHENKTNSSGSWTTPSGKIGVMYVSDYMLALGENSLSYTGENVTLKTGWMHITNNDTATLSPTGSASPSSDEHVMSRHSYQYVSSIINAYVNYIWYIHSDGHVEAEASNGSNSVRPVFYLNSDVLCESGDGTSADPYIIS